MKNEPVTVICSYRVQESRLDDFAALLHDHWPTLREAGLVTDREVQHFRGEDQGRGPHFVEIFEWRSEEAARIAHNTPEVMRVWEGMGTCIEARGELPGMEFPHFQPYMP